MPGANLSCFDGEHWLKPESASKNSVIRNRITAMFPGRNGKLWFALKDELRVYDGTKRRPGLKMSEAIEEDDPVTVRVGLQDSSGCIWLGTTHGILRFDEQRKEWRICNPFEQNSTSTSSALKDRYVREIAKRGIIAIYEDRRRPEKTGVRDLAGRYRWPSIKNDLVDQRLRGTARGTARCGSRHPNLCASSGHDDRRLERSRHDPDRYG